ncbi:MAG TPA: hypothetical protein VM600_08525 [Actinomycetota bacterium]|nr:hypothetical protein [Actinomycetota bacterium]
MRRGLLRVLGVVGFMLFVAHQPALALTEFHPPYAQGDGYADGGCRSGFAPGSRCENSFAIDRQTGFVTAAAHATSPGNGSEFGFAGTDANAVFQTEHVIPQPAGAIEGFLDLDVRRAAVSKTCAFPECPLFSGTAYVELHVDIDVQGCGSNCARRYEHRLVDLHRGPPSISDRRLRIPFVIFNDSIGRIPSGSAIVRVWVWAWVDNRSDPPFPPAGKGTVSAEIEAHLRGITLQET